MLLVRLGIDVLRCPPLVQAVLARSACLPDRMAIEFVLKRWDKFFCQFLPLFGRKFKNN
jgi:hypothetical protein